MPKSSLWKKFECNYLEAVSPALIQFHLQRKAAADLLGSIQFLDFAYYSYNGSTVILIGMISVMSSSKNIWKIFSI